MSFKKLTNWTAKRAGSKITIDALDAAGKPIKVVGVETIAGPADKGGRTVAIDMDGKRYELV